MKNRLISIALVAAASTYCQAETSSGWSKIKEIHSGWGVKRINLVFESMESPDPNQCEYVDKYQAQADEEAANIDQIIATSLSAFMAGKEVRVVIDDDLCAKGGRPRIIALDLR